MGHSNVKSTTMVAAPSPPLTKPPLWKQLRHRDSYAPTPPHTTPTPVETAPHPHRDSYTSPQRHLYIPTETATLPREDSYTPLLWKQLHPLSWKQVYFPTARASSLLDTATSPLETSFILGLVVGACTRWFWSFSSALFGLWGAGSFG